MPDAASASWITDIETGTWSYFVATNNTVTSSNNVISINSTVDSLNWNAGTMAYYRFPQGVKKGKYKLTIKFKSNTADKQGIIRFVQRTSDNTSYGYLYISANEEIGTSNAVYPKLTTAQVQTGDFIDLTYYVDFSSVDDSSKVFLYLCSNKSHLALYEFKDIKIEEVIE